MTNQHQKQRRPGRGRRIWVAAVGLALMLPAVPRLHAQDNPGNDPLFAGTEQFAKGAKDSTEVNLDKNMLNMAGNSLLTKKEDGGELAKQLDLVEIRTYDYASPGQYKLEDVQKYTKKLDGGGWTHVVRVRSSSESTDICFRGGDDGEPGELVIIAAEPTEVSFVHLKGRLSLDDLSKVGKQYGAPALQARPH